MRFVENAVIGSPRYSAYGAPGAEGDPVDLSQPAIVTVAGMFQRKGITEPEAEPASMEANLLEEIRDLLAKK